MQSRTYTLRSTQLGHPSPSGASLIARRSSDSQRGEVPGSYNFKKKVLLCVLCGFQEEEFELTDFEDYDDENGDIFADPASTSGVCVYPAACRVVYSYQVVHSL